MSVKGARASVRPADLFDRRRWLALAYAPPPTMERVEHWLYYIYKTAVTNEGLMTDFALARRAMVDSQLRPQGVTDTAVLTAMGTVAREHYVPEAARTVAYTDRAIPVEGGTIIPPASLGRLLTAALPIPGERALVVSAAPGYAAAVLREIGLSVVEASAADSLTAAPAGPFDLILIEGAVAEPPVSITRALAPGGRLVTALLVDGGGTRLAIGRTVDGVVGYSSFADSEIAALPGYSRPSVFTF